MMGLPLLAKRNWMKRTLFTLIIFRESNAYFSEEYTFIWYVYLKKMDTENGGAISWGRTYEQVIISH